VCFGINRKYPVSYTSILKTAQIIRCTNPKVIDTMQQTFYNGALYKGKDSTSDVMIIE